VKSRYQRSMKRVLEFHAASSLSEMVHEPEHLPDALTNTYYKRYPRFPSVELDRSASPKHVVIHRSATIRHYSRSRSISFHELSQLLASIGERQNGLVPARWYPSAGARYPIETYLVAWRIRGIHSGVYHYDVRGHRLERMGTAIADVQQEMIVSPYVKDASAAIIFTSCLSRVVIKYGLRGYSYSLLEAGHIGQTLLISASQLGLGTCCVGGFVMPHITSLLDLATTEVPVYVIAVGKRSRAAR